MKAMVIDRIPSLSKPDAPLTAVELPVSEPEALEIRIRVRACGVCHAELDEIEGRTAPPRLPVVPGHEVVGRVDKLGAGSGRFEIGERVGEFLPIAAEIPLSPQVKTYRLEEANRALLEVKRGPVRGAKVLLID